MKDGSISAMTPCFANGTYANSIRTDRILFVPMSWLIFGEPTLRRPAANDHATLISYCTQSRSASLRGARLPMGVSWRGACSAANDHAKNCADLRDHL